MRSGRRSVLGPLPLLPLRLLTLENLVTGGLYHSCARAPASRLPAWGSSPPRHGVLQGCQEQTPCHSDGEGASGDRAVTEAFSQHLLVPSGEV